MALSLENKKDFAGLNSGTAIIAKEVNLADIKTHETFSNLFPIKQRVYDQLLESIQKYGFRKEHPLLVWKEKGVLLDGHTRKLVCEKLGIKRVPVCEISFITEEDALEHTIGIQVGRRNLTDAEIIISIEKLDKLKQRGRSFSNEPKGKSAQHLAEVLGTSTSKVEKARAITKKATPEIKKAIETDALSINAAYQTTRKKTETRFISLLKKIQSMKAEELASFFVENVQNQNLTSQEWELKLKKEFFNDNKNNSKG